MPLFLLLSLLATACKPAGPVQAPGGNAAPSAGTGSGAASAAGGSGPVRIVGAGATFPYPIYSRWGHAWNEKTKVEVNYQSIGSGGGIKQIKAKTVDFGASDAPLTADELQKDGLVQFPMVIGAVVPAINLKGMPDGLSLDGTTLAAMYLGEIKTWNDPRIAALNPGAALPASAVTPVYRADGSGTTWIFTNYLSKVSLTWKEKVGNDKTVSWPVGVGGKGNEGVAAYVQRVDGSIGYVEYAYAIQNKLAVAKMKNKDGQVVAPSIEAFQAAAASADWANAPGFYMVLTEQPGATSWPIAGASFILMHKDQPDAAKAAGILKFFDFAYRSGADMAKELHYVPMPANVMDLVQKSWDAIRSGAKPVWQAAAAVRTEP